MKKMRMHFGVRIHGVVKHLKRRRIKQNSHQLLNLLPKMENRLPIFVNLPNHTKKHSPIINKM